MKLSHLKKSGIISWGLLSTRERQNHLQVRCYSIIKIHSAPKNVNFKKKTTLERSYMLGEATTIFILILVVRFVCIERPNPRITLVILKVTRKIMTYGQS